MRIRRRTLWSIAPLALLIVLGTAALRQADTVGIPELSIQRAKDILETDVTRKSSSPTVTNEFIWTSFAWQGEGDVSLGPGSVTSPLRARFAKVNLNWTQTTRTRLGDLVRVVTYTTRPVELFTSTAQAKFVQLPETLAFFKPQQASWTYKWQAGY